MAVSVRRCTDDADLARSVEIYNAVWPHRAVSLEDAQAFKRAVLAAEEFLATVAGAEVGSAVAALQRERPGECFALITVLPGSRRHGVGSALYSAVSAWAREHALDAIVTFVDGDDLTSVEFANRRGFVETSREIGLALEVASTVAEPTEPPPGVQIVSLLDRPDLASGVYDVEMEAAPDVPGYEDWTPPPRKLWIETHLFGPSTPPDAVLLALSEDEVVAYAKLNLAPDGRSARHGMTAVKRSWRGRGVATALKRGQIEWARAHEIERLTSTNEVRNDRMRRINESLGYQPAAGRATLRGPLASSTPSARRDA